MSLRLTHRQGQAPTFDQYYLQGVTAAFADDIDKIRGAGDFTDSSLPMLIEALRQGVSIYGQAERERVLGTGKKGELKGN